MITMMEHPKHGRHPATGHEIEHLKSLGWTILPPKNAPAKVVADTTQEEAVAPRQKRAYNRRQA